MKQVNCLNLCEILPYLQKKRNLDEIVKSAMEAAHYTNCSRIYIGTSFCGKYFLQQSDQTVKELLSLCKEKNINVTLVLPVFSEGDLENGKKRIEQLIGYGEGVFDEFTANDVGILSYLKDTFKMDINIGRLFMKDYRDPRFEEYYELPWKPKMFTNYFKKLLEEYQIKGCEFDLTHRYLDFSELPAGIVPGIHVPYTYQTVGRICEYASIHKEISKKYRPNDKCDNTCKESMIKYSVSDGNMEYVRFGRTVYFKQPEQKGSDKDTLNSLKNQQGADAYRLIYFPIDLQ